MGVRPGCAREKGRTARRPKSRVSLTRIFHPTIAKLFLKRRDLVLCQNSLLVYKNLREAGSTELYRMPPTTEQESLIACLSRRSEKLARIYGSCLPVFYDNANPGRLPLAAHAMRELIDKSPILTDRQPVPQGDTVGNRIQLVKQAYLAMKEHGFDNNFPLDAAEGSIRRVLAALDGFFEWMENNRPQLAKKTAEMLSDLSGPGQALPVDVSNSEVDRWIAANDYFKKVAHHGQDSVNENEFMIHMTFVESVLLQRLQPPAVADLDALDALIQEGESGQ